MNLLSNHDSSKRPSTNRENSTSLKEHPAIFACQNGDMLSETGLLCLKIQEAFEKEAL